MEIVNLVVVVTMDDVFDLDFMLMNIPETKKANVWLKMRVQPENYYVAFYGSGKFLITGLKNEEDIQRIVNKVLNILTEHNIGNNLKNIAIKNVVAVDELGYDVNLQNLILNLGYDSSYEPEQFPGLFYKDEDNLSYTLFSSGKIIITGFIDFNLAKNNLIKFKELIKILI